MYKKISVLVLLLSCLVCGFRDKNQEFTYKYEIILNSNDAKDIVQGYLYKEYLIDEYNRVINYVDSSLHTNAVINNIDSFAKEGSHSEYKEGKIVVYIGNAKGDVINGTLKNNTCDTTNIRVKFFFSKFFVK
jgi:hypothetical protein